MRQSLQFLLIFASSLLSLLVSSLLPSQACATPIYLRLDSRFSSGSNSREWLEAHTAKIQFQRWAHVETADHKRGWIAEDHLLTPLKLAEHAVLAHDVPARVEPQLDTIAGRTQLKKDTEVEIIVVDGSWTQVRTLASGISYVAWVQNENLKPLVGGVPTKAFVHRATDLLVMPDAQARAFDRVPAEHFVEVIRKVKSYLEVRTDRSRGYIRASDAWTLEDLGPTGVRPLLALTPLHALALPYSETTRELALETSLKVLGSETLRWGQVTIADMGPMWWPMADEKNTAENGKPKEKVLQLTTGELFERKLFDMAASRAVPSLKFASAQGVFRTTDGETWTQIPLFKNENYPIAMAKGGAIFIGPYVSEDHGETFQQWIRWDTLVATLDLAGGVTANNVQILEMRPRDAAGRKLVISLGVGQEKPVKLVTDDQGTTWKSLN